MFDDTPRRRKSGHFMKSSWRDALRQGCCQGVQLPSHSENHGKEVLFDWEQCADIANQRAVIRRDQLSTCLPGLTRCAVALACTLLDLDQRETVTLRGVQNCHG
jgi:hypothetical protein